MMISKYSISPKNNLPRVLFSTKFSSAFFLILFGLSTLACGTSLKQITTTPVKNSRSINLSSSPPVKGRFVMAVVRCGSSLCDPVRGELLHINAEHLFLSSAKKRCPIRVNIADLVELTLRKHYFDVDTNFGSFITGSILGTLSNGFLLFLTAPITAITSLIAVQSYGHVNEEMEISGEDVHSNIDTLTYFSRFPGPFPKEAFKECTASKDVIVEKKKSGSVEVEYSDGNQNTDSFSEPKVSSGSMITRSIGSKLSLRFDSAIGVNPISTRLEAIGSLLGLAHLSKYFSIFVSLQHTTASSYYWTSQDTDNLPRYLGSLSPKYGGGAELVVVRGRNSEFVLQGSLLFSQMTIDEINNEDQFIFYDLKIGYRLPGLISNYGIYFGLNLADFDNLYLDRESSDWTFYTPAEPIANFNLTFSMDLN